MQRWHLFEAQIQKGEFLGGKIWSKSKSLRQAVLAVFMAPL